MALCSVPDVRARVYTSTLTDFDISDIITDVTEEILGLAESTDESNPLLILAGKNAACAATLRKMRTTGEMAANKKRGNAQEQNTIDQDIKDYEAKAEMLIQKFKDSVTYSNFSLASGRMGYGTVNDELS